MKTSTFLTITRILAGFLSAAFIIWGVNGLMMIIFSFVAGEYLVALVLASETVAYGIFSAICAIFALRGNFSARRLQAGRGCLFSILAGFSAVLIAGLLIAILDLESQSETSLKLSLVFISAALGGGLGLYLARPSSTRLPDGGNLAEDRVESEGNQELVQYHFQPKLAPDLNPIPESTGSKEAQKRANRRILAWLFCIGCLIPVVCIGAVTLLGFAGRLSGSPGETDARPAWSPDGQYIAFHSDRSGNFDIYTMKADGSNVAQLTENKFALLWQLIMIDTSGDAYPSWSPDGKKIAFMSGRNNNMMTYVDFDIFIMNQDGTEVANRTPYSEVELRPAWSPDGARILFEADFDSTEEISSDKSKNWDIFAMNSDGSGIVRLTYHLASEGQATWSPDGKRIAFISDRNGNSDIFVMDANGTHLAKLTSGLANDEEPNWSPDGNQIVFASDRDGNRELYIMDANGSNIEMITIGKGDKADPAWSPDGNRIVFSSDRDGDWDIYVVDVDGSNLVQLTGK